jgi:hypothetical protein
MEQSDNAKLNEDEQIGGYVDVEVWRDGKHGPELIQHVRSHNLVMNAGKKHIWELVSGHKATHFNQMRLGSNSAAATSGGTQVKTAIAGSRNTCDSVTLGTGRTFVWMNSYPSGSATTTGGVLSFAAAKEVVICCNNATPGGTCMMRCVFTSVAKTKADKLKITYSARIS